MEMLIFFGVVILLMVATQFTKEKDILRIELDQVTKFLALMVFVTLIRIAFYDFMRDVGGVKSFPMIPPEISEHKWSLALVFWEDFCFGVPIYLAFKYLKRKWISVVITIFLSLLFASGHMYEGKQAVVLTAFLPYFGFYKYGKKFGFGTTMVCHILYDFLTFYTMWLLPLLL